jgi:signal transduction histidine kinase
LAAHDSDQDTSVAPLPELADYLSARIEEVIASCRERSRTDPLVPTAHTLTRAQFLDHLPAAIGALIQRLRSSDSAEKDYSSKLERHSAKVHGVHRWQQGYNLSETMREWQHLHMCLMKHVQSYVEEQPQARMPQLLPALRELAHFVGEAVSSSADQHGHLQAREAAERVRELETAVTELRTLEQQRAELWREAVHDLRGSVGVLRSTSAALVQDSLEENLRSKSQHRLERSVSSLHDLLSELTELSRLQAGQDRRKLAPTDVAQVIRELCEMMRPVAVDRGLFLRCSGPERLEVEGDAVKVRRIAQNLMSNAIGYTERGGVSVKWTREHGSSPRHWILAIEDTGPGFEAPGDKSIASELKAATENAPDVEKHRESTGTQVDRCASTRSATPGVSTPPDRGEGLGLSIVKHLCELLDASLELESSREKGTVVRVIFPIGYEQPPSAPG